MLSRLQGQRYWPGAELADGLEVSVRTLRRNVDRPRELGYSVQAHRGSTGALGQRIAGPSARGINVLLQCWVNHNSRVVVPIGDFLKAVGDVFEEADLVEEWCEARLGLDPTAAMAECVAWLREPSVHGGVTRQRDARGGTTPQRHPAADAQAPALALATSPYALQ